MTGHLADPLPRWKHAVRLAVVWLLGGGIFLTVYSTLTAIDPSGPGPAASWMVLDLFAGHVALALAAFRRRAPATITALVGALTALSSFAAPAAVLATLSLATRRRVVPLIWPGLILAGAALVNDRIVMPHAMPADLEPRVAGQGWLLHGILLVTLSILAYLVVALIGWNIGSRRELVASWRRQAESAAREQAATVAQAQHAERARIAREMHDVLAHRLSLVAMHAGALAHRTDLSESERAEAAEVVRSGAHQALVELREVLGVLRAEGEGHDGRVEAPQPGLSDLPALVAEANGGGQAVRLVAHEELWQRSMTLPESTGRHVYRVVQEALTNARKHAPKSPVTVELDGRPGEGLSLVVSNPLARTGRLPSRADASLPDAAGLPSGGRGLVGMAERVQLAGGRLEAGAEVTHFVVRAWLPWSCGGRDG